MSYSLPLTELYHTQGKIIVVAALGTRGHAAELVVKPRAQRLRQGGQDAPELLIFLFVLRRS
jgi:hypothetical protein